LTLKRASKSSVQSRSGPYLPLGPKQSSSNMKLGCSGALLRRTGWDYPLFVCGGPPREKSASGWGVTEARQSLPEGHPEEDRRRLGGRRTGRKRPPDETSKGVTKSLQLVGVRYIFDYFRDNFSDRPCSGRFWQFVVSTPQNAPSYSANAPSSKSPRGRIGGPAGHVVPGLQEQSTRALEARLLGEKSGVHEQS